MIRQTMGERLNAVAAAGASIARAATIIEVLRGQGEYRFKAVGPREIYRKRYGELRLDMLNEHARDVFAGAISDIYVPHVDAFVELPADADLRARMVELLEPKWDEPKLNTIMTGGKNDLLDKYLAGSGYTAAWYMGLISSTSYSAIAAGDTMSSHAGWLEAGTANAPTYSQSTRVAPSWASASAGSKASNANIVYSITGTGTAKGGFLTSVSTKDGTTGILFSGALFTQGDRAVVNLDTINGSYTLAV